MFASKQNKADHMHFEQKYRHWAASRSQDSHYADCSTALFAGLVNPAAVKLPTNEWVMIVMSFRGCFGSDCALQVMPLGHELP